MLRALTGMEPDRWEEERRRGLTIDLGFAWTERLAFVDVPGHEHFVTNMLAGVGAVPVVLFVVAADEGWQVQSQEHLDIIDALGIRYGVLAVTRTDIADPTDTLAQASERLAKTGLAAAPRLTVSAVTGAGLAELRTALHDLAVPAPDPAADVRLWADRVFTMAGRGTVATGTLGAGTITVGDKLAVRGETVHVRGLHSLGRPCEEVTGPARVAVNVRGRPTEDLRRGEVLVTPGRWLETTVVDVRLRPVGEGFGTAADRARENDGGWGRRVPGASTWHLGAAAVPARIRMLGGDAARVTLAIGLPMRIGDRALLRDPGSRRVWGVTVLDVRPPELGRRGAAGLRAIELAAMNGVPDAAKELRRRGLIRRDELAAMGVQPVGLVVGGHWLADPEHWAGLRARLAGMACERAAHSPGDPGLTPDEVRRALELPDRSLVDALITGMELRWVRGRISATKPELPAAARKAVEVLMEQWSQEPFCAPSADALAQLGLSARELAAAEAAGALIRVAPGVVLPPDAVERTVRALKALSQPFTVAQAREVLGTSRRVLIPLLEHLDSVGYTHRNPDFSREVIDR